MPTRRPCPIVALPAGASSTAALATQALAEWLERRVNGRQQAARTAQPVRGAT